MSGKVTGVASAKIEELQHQSESLRNEALRHLIAYYSAPEGNEGSEQRKNASDLLQEAWREENKVRGQSDGIQVLKEEAIASKDDLERWFKLIV